MAAPIIELILTVLIMILTALPRAVADAGSRVLSRTVFLPNPRLLVRGGGHKSDLLHLRQGFFPAEVPVVFDHLAVGVANPLADLALGGTPQETLAYEKMPEGCSRPCSKPFLPAGTGNLFFNLSITSRMNAPSTFRGRSWPPRSAWNTRPSGSRFIFESISRSRGWIGIWRELLPFVVRIYNKSCRLCLTPDRSFVCIPVQVVPGWG